MQPCLTKIKSPVDVYSVVYECGYETLSDLLWCEYVENGRSTLEVSELVGVKMGTVSVWLKKLGAEMRPRGGKNRVHKNRESSGVYRKQCPVCKKKFRTNSRWIYFCSQKCRTRADDVPEYYGMFFNRYATF